MSYSVLFHTGAQSTGASTGATTGALDSSGANLIAICIVASGSASGITVSDSKSNTWSVLTSPGGVYLLMYYCFAPTVGSGHTFSIAATNGYTSITVLGASGAVASPFDQENQAADYQPGSVTPSEDNELVLTALGFGSAGGTSSVDSGFTKVEDLDFSGGNAYGIALAYKIQTSAAAVNPTWSNSAGSAVSKIATFKAAVVSGNPWYYYAQQ